MVANSLRRCARITALSSCASLAACGGGGGEATPSQSAASAAVVNGQNYIAVSATLVDVANQFTHGAGRPSAQDILDNFGLGTTACAQGGTVRVQQAPENTEIDDPGTPDPTNTLGGGSIARPDVLVQLSGCRQAFGGLPFTGESTDGVLYYYDRTYDENADAATWTVEFDLMLNDSGRAYTTIYKIDEQAEDNGAIRTGSFGDIQFVDRSGARHRFRHSGIDLAGADPGRYESSATGYIDNLEVESDLRYSAAQATLRLANLSGGTLTVRDGNQTVVTGSVSGGQVTLTLNPGTANAVETTISTAQFEQASAY